jgi:hypothetical protein
MKINELYNHKNVLFIRIDSYLPQKWYNIIKGEYNIRDSIFNIDTIFKESILIKSFLSNHFNPPLNKDSFIYFMNYYAWKDLDKYIPVGIIIKISINDIKEDTIFNYMNNYSLLNWKEANIDTIKMCILFNHMIMKYTAK